MSLSILCHLSILRYHKDNDTSVWEGLSRGTSHCNEEAGEIFLSLLARSVSKKGAKKGDLHELRKTLLLLPVVWSSSRTLMKDMETEGHLAKGKHQNIRLSEECKEKVCLEFTDIINESVDLFMGARDDTKEEMDARRAQTSKQKAKVQRDVALGFKFSRPRIEAQLTKHRAFMQNVLGGFFGETELKHWPLSGVEQKLYGGMLQEEEVVRDNASAALPSESDEDFTSDDEWKSSDTDASESVSYPHAHKQTKA